MAEVVEPGSPTPPAAPAAPAPAEPKGLEKVYSDFKIEETAQEFNPQSPQPAPQPQPQAPGPKFDPFDPNFAAHMQTVSKAAAEAHTALQQTEGRLNALERQLHVRAVEADIKQAVGTLTEGTGLKPKIAEVAMEAKAREDVRFRAIWMNRAKNPTAYQAALKAFKQELQDEYTVRQDPQLAENQRAIKASQQQMATTTKETPNSKWENMTYEERQRETDRIRRMG
jgi:hypothetical protein